MDILFNARLVGIGFVDGFEFADGLVPGTGFTEGARAGFASFGVRVIEGKGAVAVGDGRFVVFKLWYKSMSVQAPPLLGLMAGEGRDGYLY